MADLVTLSASKLKTYSSCPRKYWYEYEEKVKGPKHPAAALGSAVHKTIERSYKEDAQPIMIFSEEYLDEVRRNDLSVDSKLYADGVDMVTKYDFQRRVPQELEYEFLLPFPNRGYSLCQIHGYLDQLYEWGFVDLKTNKRKPLRGVLDNDLQFIVYAWAYEQIYDYAPQLSIWHQLRTSEDLPADVANDEKLDLATRVVERILESQVTGIFDKNVGDACTFCSHKEPCLGRAD